MAIIYMNGAEHAVMMTGGGMILDGIIESGGVVSIDTSIFKGGARSYKFDGGAGGSGTAYIIVNGFGTEAVVQFRFRKNQNPVTNKCCIFSLSSGLSSMDIYILPTGELEVSSLAGGTPRTSGVLADNTWHQVDISADVSSSLWLLDWAVNEIPQTGFTMTESGQVESAIFFGNNISSASVGADLIVNFDDIVVDDTAGSYPLAPMYIKGYYPNGVGTHNLDASPSLNFFKHDGSTRTALTTGETTSHQMIDEIPLPSSLADRIQLEAVIGSPTLPTWVGAGTPTGNAAAVSPGIPASTQANDILICLVETANQTKPTLTGGNLTWTEIGDVGANAFGTTSTRITAFWARRTSTAPTGPTTNDTGDHQHAVIVAFRGCVSSGSPIGDSVTSSETAVDTSGSATGITTPTDNEMVCLAVATSLPDAAATAAAIFSGWTQGNLGSITERVDASTNAGNGGGLAFMHGSKATAGATGAITFTSPSAAKAMIVFSLKGAISITEPDGSKYAAYTLQDSSEPDDPIACVFWAALVNGSSGSSQIGIRLWDGTNEAILLNTNLSTVMQYLGLLVQTNLTGGLWTNTIFNSLQFRVGFSTLAQNIPRLEGFMAEALFPDASGPALIPIALSANLTATPVISRVGQYKKAPAVTMTMTPVLNRKRFDLTNLPLSMATVVSMVKRKNITVPADLTMTGGITMRLTRLVNMAANLPLTAALVKKGQYFKTLPATVTFTNAITMRMTRVRLLAANLTATTVLNRRLNRTVAAGVTLTPVISFGKFLQKQINATVTSTPAIILVKVKLQAISANLTMTGAMTLKSIGQKLIAGTLTMQPTQNRRLNKTVAAGLTMTPVLVRKGTYYKLLALTLTLSPNVTTRKTVYYAIAATVTHTAQMTMIRILKLQLSANMPITTALNRRLNRTLNSGLNLVGVVQADKLVGIRFISLPATVTMGVAMVKVLSGSKLLSVAVALDTALTRLKVAPRLLAAPVTLQPALVRRLNRTLAVTLATNPVITPLKMKFVTIAATITNVIVITRRKLALRTLAANLPTTNVITRLGLKRLDTTLTLDPVMRRRYFRTLAVNLQTQPVIDRIASNGIIALEATITLTAKMEKAATRSLAVTLLLSPVITFNRLIIRFRDWLLSARMDEPVLDSAEIDEPELISAVWRDE